MGEPASGRILLVASVTVIVTGIGVEYYAQALGGLLVSTCDGVDLTTSNRCAWPHGLALLGLVSMGAGALGLLVGAVRRFTSRAPARELSD
jgi:hypothetical protein